METVGTFSGIHKSLGTFKVWCYETKGDAMANMKVFWCFNG